MSDARISTPVEPTAHLIHPVSTHVVDLDVRDALRSGKEPFSTIMDAVSKLNAGELLHLRTIFEPAPLVAILAKRGFSHESRAHAADDWSSWFWRPNEHEGKDAPVATAGSMVGDVDAATTWLDVRGLEPPEPMMRTLAALETLPAGHVLVQVNDRVPQLLFPLLADGGFACDVDESQDDRVLVRIWRAC